VRLKNERHQLIQSYGYPIQVHEIVTEDGYILQTFRIPYGKRTNTSKPRHPVLLVPGMGCTSIVYLAMGPDRGSIGFMLADEGFDVWLANCRGTKWSKKHKTLDPVRDKKLFFDFSFQEVGLYDITANIDYILNATNFKQLFYIGISQGTTDFFLMAAAKPEYNEKVTLAIALAPVAYCSNVQHPLTSFIKRRFKQVKATADNMGVYEILSESSVSSLFVRAYVDIFCKEYSSIKFICTTPVYLMGEFDYNYNKSAVPVIFSEMPSTISMKTVYHYTQMALSGQFEMYDDGITGNLRKYGQTTTPQLNISKITTPVALYCGPNDRFSTRADVELLALELPNLVKKVYVGDYGHVDFAIARNAASMVYDDIIETMKNCSNKTAIS
ncbi:lipase 3-like, partial [Photinus pyralis]|uniref:lipase 3-like n=1 Tax=Photinus pyralis TaxID=7054 RepID=UPI0012674BAF